MRIQFNAHYCKMHMWMYARGSSFGSGQAVCHATGLRPRCAAEICQSNRRVPATHKTGAAIHPSRWNYKDHVST